MYNLFIFIEKHNAVILFVLLEILCIVMIVYSLPYQNRKMSNISNEIAGEMYKTTSNWKDYFNLRHDNEILAQHNALLMSKLANESADADSVISSENFIFIPAHVINNSLNDINNYIVIDKGRTDGIEPEMGVICDNGVVGKVINVSNNFASVMSLLNSYSVVSCRFIDNQYVANVVWDYKDFRYGMVKDIPSHIVINRGDTLVTSGFSNSYPADIIVGTIESYEKNPEDMFSTARLLFATNFSTLRHVYVVKNNFKAEIDSLCITH